MGKTLFDKVWDNHVVESIKDGPDIFFIDKHLIHEVTSPQAFDELKEKNLEVFDPKRVLATAKEAQGLLELKISKLEETLANARLIDESQLDSSKILVLSKVKIKNLMNNMELEYQLVAESEANLREGKISVNSPIGKGLLGKTKGDIAEISVPNGVIKFEIISISR